MKGNLICLFVVFISYIIEINSNWKLLIHNFEYPKNLFIKTGAANFHALLYFFTNFIVLIRDLYKIDPNPVGYSFWKWLVIIIPLTIIVRMLYLKYTAFDPNRSDDDHG